MKTFSFFLFMYDTKSFLKTNETEFSFVPVPASKNFFKVCIYKLLQCSVLFVKIWNRFMPDGEYIVCIVGRY